VGARENTCTPNLKSASLNLTRAHPCLGSAAPILSIAHMPLHYPINNDIINDQFSCVSSIPFLLPFTPLNVSLHSQHHAGRWLISFAHLCTGIAILGSTLSTLALVSPSLSLPPPSSLGPVCAQGLLVSRWHSLCASLHLSVFCLPWVSLHLSVFCRPLSLPRFVPLPLSRSPKLN
jgi:hypothetical protein